MFCSSYRLDQRECDFQFKHLCVKCCISGSESPASRQLDIEAEQLKQKTSKEISQPAGAKGEPTQ